MKPIEIEIMGGQLTALTPLEITISLTGSGKEYTVQVFKNTETGMICARCWALSIKTEANDLEQLLLNVTAMIPELGGLQ